MRRTCTFFGHRDCPETIKPAIKNAIEDLIHKHNVTMFYVVDSGQFDAYCRIVLKELGVDYAVVLSRMPLKRNPYDDDSDTIFPSEIENGPPRFCIERRNRFMLEKSDFIICYVRHRLYGGAAKFITLAERKGRTVINLYSLDKLNP